MREVNRDRETERDDDVQVGHEVGIVSPQALSEDHAERGEKDENGISGVPVHRIDLERERAEIPRECAQDERGDADPFLEEVGDHDLFLS